MAFTFLHAADIHLDSPLRGLESYEDAPVEQIRQATRRAFDNLINLAIDEQVAFLLLAGDLYDGGWKDYNTGLFFIDRMARLRREGIPVFMVSGNHDAESQIARTLPLPENVHLFQTRKPETIRIESHAVALHGQGYATRAVAENLSAGFPQYDPHCFNIGLLHTSLTGREGHESYAPCSLDDLKAKGYGYWALGHIHRREVVSEDPMIVFPGNIQGRHILEQGAKGATLVSVDQGRITGIEHRELDVLRWAQCSIDITSCENREMVLAMVREALEDLQDNGTGRTLAVRVQLTGRSELHSLLHAEAPYLTEQIRAIAAGLGEIWLEKAVLATQREENILEAMGADTPFADLITALNDLELHPDQIQDLAPDFAALKNNLPPELLQDDPDILPSTPEKAALFCDEVKEILIAKLLGKGEEFQ